MTPRLSLALLALAILGPLPSPGATSPNAPALPASRPVGAPSDQASPYEAAPATDDWDKVLQRLGPPQDTAVDPAVKARLEAPAPMPPTPTPVAKSPAPAPEVPSVAQAVPTPTPAPAPEVATAVAVTPVAATSTPTVATPPKATEESGDLPVTFGRFISSDRSLLYNSGKYVELNYVDEPMQNVLRRLARASGINFIMPKIDGSRVSLSQKGNPFGIMESLIESQGMGLVRRGDTWLITSLDRVNLKPEVYKFTHIHLDREFSFRDSTNGGSGSSGQQGGSGGTMGGSSGMMGGGGGTLGSYGGMQGGGSGGSQNSSLVTNPANLTAPRSVDERMSGNSQLLATLEKILEFGMDNAMDPGKERVNINDRASGSGDGKSGSKKTSKAIYSYDPDANSLFVVATEQQHAWVRKWVETIDQPTHNIQIEIQFISSGGSNGSALGLDWGGGANGGGLVGMGVHIQDPTAASTGTTSGTTVSTGSGTLTFGALNGLKAPVSSILSADALSLRLNALRSNTDTRTTKKPLLTTLTNREVLINNTQNQPVVMSNNSGSTTTGAGVGGSTTSASSNSISNENIGTVTRILPRIISGDLISLSVNIDITNLLRTTVINGNEYPIIAKTGFTNEVKLRSGYSVVIGGLEEMVSKETINKVPLLGDIPFFGFAFKDLVKGKDISNLSLIITVRIIDESGNECHATPPPPPPAVAKN